MMSDNVKDFAYYAEAAERVIDTIQDDWPTVDVAATAAIAQVFATLACGAPEPQEARQISCEQAHPQYGAYHPEGHTNRAQAKCIAGIQNTDNFQHAHTCELTIFHTAKHTCVCGTEWS
jgi:hypothetical protein